MLGMGVSGGQSFTTQDLSLYFVPQFVRILFQCTVLNIVLACQHQLVGHLGEQQSEKALSGIESGYRVHLLDCVDEARNGRVDDVGRSGAIVQLIQMPLQGFKISNLIFGLVDGIRYSGSM